MKSQVSIVKCPDYNPLLVQKATKEAIDLLGGISDFIKPKSRVLVKPNLLMAKGPECAITTHPEVVRAVIKILKEIECKIFVGDGPSVFGDQMSKVREVYACSGIENVCHEESVELVEFDKKRWRGKFPLTTWLDDCDSIVNIPKFKTHNLTILTGAIKNLFGLVYGTFKVELHKQHFDREEFSDILVDVYQEVRPEFTIVDGIVSLEGDGPSTSGKPRNTGILLAGLDCVAIDSILAVFMGLKPEDILTTKKAAQRNLGISDLNSIIILGEKLEDVMKKPVMLPVTAFSLNRRLREPIIKMAMRLIKYYPLIMGESCIGCSVCMRACPHKAITMKNERMIIEYARCQACFCCQEACPNAAIKVKRNIFAKILGW